MRRRSEEKSATQTESISSGPKIESDSNTSPNWSHTASKESKKNETFSGPKIMHNLPQVLAEDEILQNLLKPTTPAKYEQLPNVLPLKVNFGASKIKFENGKKYCITEVNKEKKVKYDPTKGFVSTTWTNFEYHSKTEPLTTDTSGIYIKHLTTNVIDPNELSKGKKVSEIDMKSYKLTSKNLGKNAWTNVYLYKPKDQLFQFDPEKKRFASKSMETAFDSSSTNNNNKSSLDGF